MTEVSAADRYAARVDAVLAQRDRLYGKKPDGDLFGSLSPDHGIMQVVVQPPLHPNHEVIGAYLEAEDVFVDVGGGAGRFSLPHSFRCREVINVDVSAGMGRGFAKNLVTYGITNARFVESDWTVAALPIGTIALANNVTYFVRDIVSFVKQLEAAGGRRVIIGVGTPPPPSRRRHLYELVHGEAEEPVPGMEELLPVLWEMGRVPEVLLLPGRIGTPWRLSPMREAAIQSELDLFRNDQWTFWDAPEPARRARTVLEQQFDDLFDLTEGGYRPRHVPAGREVLITWRPGVDHVD